MSPVQSLETEAPRAPYAGYPSGLRVAMLLLNFFPLLLVLAIIATSQMATLSVSMRVTAALVELLILPPLLARLVHAWVPMPPGRYPIESREFLSWWATAQFQMIFNRIPMIEEMMRLVPGIYSNWLRLWGSKIGRLTFWSPGLVVLDREYLDLGDDVVFGAGVRLNGHVILRTSDGRLELVAAPIKIGSASAIGGYSLLTAGTVVAAGETTHAHLLSPPFSIWQGGKRVKRNADQWP